MRMINMKVGDTVRIKDVYGSYSCYNGQVGEVTLIENDSKWPVNVSLKGRDYCFGFNEVVPVFKVGDIVRPIREIVTKNLIKESIEFGLTEKEVKEKLLAETFDLFCSNAHVVVKIEEGEKFSVLLAAYDLNGNLRELPSKEEELELA